MNLDQTVIQRVGYTVPDLLSDIGGIEALVFSLFGILIGVWNHNNFDNHLVSKIFMMEVKNEKYKKAFSKNKSKDL